MGKEPFASKLSGTVEVDETYVGGKIRSGRYPYRDKDGNRVKPQYQNKTPVVALVERGGRVKAFPMSNPDMLRMRDVLVANTDEANTHLMTDEAAYYSKAVKASNFKKHETIRHLSKVYAVGNVYTNTVEGFFSLLKRGIVGTFHHVSKGHLHRYVSEFAFRYNNRVALGIDDEQRTVNLVQGAEGKRLTFKQPSGASAA